MNRPSSKRPKGAVVLRPSAQVRANMRQILGRAIWVIVIALWHVGGLPLVQAAPTLSVSSLRGGSTSDLGELTATRRSSHEEVTVVAANTTAQYRVMSELSRPLINERGVVLDLSLIMMEVVEGNTGTARFRGAATMPGGPVEVFTSNSSGQADRLKIIYSINVAQLPQAGIYTGALTFSLQPTDGSSVQTTTVPMRLLVNPGASLQVSDFSNDRLRFGNLDPGKVSDPRRISLDIAGNLPGAFQLLQTVEARLMNERGEAFPLNAIHATASLGGSALLHQALEPHMTLVASEWGAESQRRVDLTYVVSVPPDQRAGVYRGLLSFTLSGLPTAGTPEPLVVRVPIELEVNAVLSLSVQPAQGGSLELTFLHLEPGTTSAPQTLQLEVQTNLEQGYEIAQDLSGPLVSASGRQLPSDALTYQASGPAGGYVLASQETPVPVGKSLVYQSEEQGGTVALAVQYRVHVPTDATADTYRSTLWCSVTAR